MFWLAGQQASGYDCGLILFAGDAASNAHVVAPTGSLMSKPVFPRLPVLTDDPGYATLFAAVFKSRSDAIFVLDEDSRILEANPAACDLLGYTSEELATLSMIDLTPEGLRQHAPAAWATFKKIGRFRKYWQLQARTGTVYDVDLACTAQILPGVHVSVARDITAQVKAEEQADLYRHTLDALDHGIIVTDHTAANEPIVYANPAASRMSGYSLPELLGQPPEFLCGPFTEQRGLNELREALRNGTGCLVELLNQRKSGEEWVNLMSLTPIRDVGGQITHYVCGLTDVTRLRGYLKNLHPERRSTPVRKDRRTVLLVDDEEGIREFVRIVLEQAGYEVLVATDGEHALQVFHGQPDRIDLVLSDVMMPRRTGPNLASELWRVRPTVPVLFMSGYTGGTPAIPIEMPAGAPVLEKPFSLDRLLRAVASTLQP
jgi:PAS domain S-box-containing protein